MGNMTTSLTGRACACVIRANGGAARVVCFFLVLGMAPFATGQAMRDPMRPPATPIEGGAAGIEVAAPGLQIVKTSNAARIAVIDGQEVRVGGKVAGSTLISLSDSVAVLRNPEGQLTTLKMFPEVDKRNSPPARAAAKGAAKNDRNREKKLEP